MKVFDIRRTVLANLIVIFILLNAPVYIANFYITQHAEKNILERTTDAININTRYFLNSFETEVERIIRLKSNYLMHDDFLQLAIEGSFLDPYSKNSLILSVKDKLEILHHSSTFVKDVKVYFPGLQRGVFASSYDDELSLADMDRIKVADSKNPLIYSPNHLSIGGVYPMSVVNDNYIQVLEIELSQVEIKKMLRSISSTNQNESGVAILYNLEEQWFLSNDAEWQIAEKVNPIALAAEQTEQYFLTEVGEEQYFVINNTSSKLGMGLLFVVPKKAITGQLKQYSYLLYAMLFVSLLLVLLFSYWIYRTIHKPFQKLMAGLRGVEQGNFDIELSTRQGDEFSIVYRQFNAMTSRLKTLIQEVYEHKIRLQLSELKQLQSQINPHFLYNSYYVIYRLAQQHNIEQVIEYTRYLGDYFKYITRNASGIVPLVSEMQHAESYAKIQLLRFSNRIKIDVDPVPEQYEQIAVPKLIIQPLLENALVHGVEQKVENGYIRLTYEGRESGLCVIVEDNGDALTDDVLLSLQHKLQLIESDSEITETTGLLNVHKRLVLKYGKPYGMTLARSDLGGLRIELVVPDSME